ncbi:MAG: NADase-type glycan-binding domain-containing protein, partial [Acidimicrobiales bacterium]
DPVGAAAEAAPAAVAAERGPVAHQPAAPQRRRQGPEAPKAPSRAIQPGDLICGQCGEGNASDRRFCRRCGTSLVEAVVAKTPWWKKLRRRKRVLKAGERPRGRRSSPGKRVGGLLKKVVVGVVVATLGLAAVPRIGPMKNPVNTWAVKQKRSIQRFLKPKFVIVHPVSAEASSFDPAHAALLAIDGAKNTFWAAAAGTPADGVGQFIVVNFDKPILLSHVGFTIGPLGKPEDFLSQPRPAKVHIVLSDAKGVSVGDKNVTLSDKADFQKFTVVGNRVSKIQIQVDQVNLSPQGGHQVSIAELEFFRKA